MTQVKWNIYACPSWGNIKKFRVVSWNYTSHLLLNNELWITTDFFSSRVNSPCDALRDMVPLVKFKKREKHSWRSVTFSKSAGISNTPSWVLFMFFKLYKWCNLYNCTICTIANGAICTIVQIVQIVQIAQSITNHFILFLFTCENVTGI